MSSALELRAGARGAEETECARFRLTRSAVAFAMMCFLIAGGNFSVTALRENDQATVSVYTKHRLSPPAIKKLTLQAPVTKSFGSWTPEEGTVAG